MLHPSYTELMDKINKESENGIDSRYSIVIATSKRAREIIAGKEPLVDSKEDDKPLSIAVKELYDMKIEILPEEVMEEELDYIDFDEEEDFTEDFYEE